MDFITYQTKRLYVLSILSTSKEPFEYRIIDGRRQGREERAGGRKERRREGRKRAEGGDGREGGCEKATDKRKNGYRVE